MNTKPMAVAGIIFVLFGLVLIGCAHQGAADENAALRDDIARTQTEFYRPPTEEIEPAIRHIIDRDPTSGRFTKITTNPLTGRPIVAKWTAYRDDTNHTVFGVEYNLTDNPK